METKDNRRDWKERNQGPMPQEDPTSKRTTHDRDFAKPGESDGPEGDTVGEPGPGGSIFPEPDTSALTSISKTEGRNASIYRVITLDRHMTMISTVSKAFADDEAAIAAARMALASSPDAASVEVWDMAGRIHREMRRS